MLIKHYRGCCRETGDQTTKIGDNFFCQALIACGDFDVS